MYMRKYKKMFIFISKNIKLIEIKLYVNDHCLVVLLMIKYLPTPQETVYKHLSILGGSQQVSIFMWI